MRFPRRKGDSVHHIGTFCLTALLVGSTAAAQGVASAQGRDFAGPRVGLTFGAAASDAEARRSGHAGDLIALDIENGLFPDEIEAREVSPIAGASVGIDMQRGRFVAGVEAGLSLLDHEQTHAFSRIDPNPDPRFNGIDTNTFYTTDIEGLATLEHWPDNLFGLMDGVRARAGGGSGAGGPGKSLLRARGRAAYRRMRQLRRPQPSSFRARPRAVTAPDEAARPADRPAARLPLPHPVSGRPHRL